jgi:hypothetical protein
MNSSELVFHNSVCQGFCLIDVLRTLVVWKDVGVEGLGNRIADFRMILKLHITVLKVSGGCRKGSIVIRWWLMGLNVEFMILEFACVYGLIEAAGKESCNLTDAHVAYINDEQTTVIDC